MRTPTLLVFTLLFLATCRSKTDKKLFELLDDTGIEFANNIESTKDFNVFSYRNFYNGGGVAIADLNNDGLSDVFFTANMGPNKLYFNKGDLKFEDVSEKAGFGNKDEWSTGVAIVDINSDGWLDIYVCNAGYLDRRVPENKLFINNKNGTFTEKAAEYGLTNRGGYCTHAAFFDYDKDGDLDVFIINNSFIPVNTLNYANKRNLRASDWPVEDFLKGGGDKMLRNDNGKFVDVSKEAGVYGSLISFGLGVTVGDVNGDDYPDVYVSNDFFERDYLYINQKNGTFKEELEQWMQHVSLSSMGADIADVNNDGYPDLFTTDMLPDDEYRLKTTSSFESIDVYRLKLRTGFYHQYMQNTLQVNNRNGKFLETAYYSGVAASDWSWGALIFDADNDGFSDIYVCNGIYHDVTDQDFIEFFADDVVQKMVLTGEKEEVDSLIRKMPSKPIVNKFFLNKGNLRFSDEGLNSGFTQKGFSNGAAYGDLDNDGDLDLVINNVNEKAYVFRNNSTELNDNKFIGFNLKGKGANLFALGSTVKLFSGNEVITRELIPSRGFQSSIEYKITMGVGKRTIDSAIITWPDGSVSMIMQPALNKVHSVTYENITVRESKAPAVVSMLEIAETPFESHKEDEYVDFYMERIVPMIMSREGPKAAIADVNGDGSDDVYIGGAAGKGGSLYLQVNGTFIKSDQQVFAQSADAEDVCALFFDSDKDGDKDLFIGSGGNNRPRGSKEYDHRLYENDGKGNFSLITNAFPASGYNTAVAANYDYDGDGDEDLFVGSRSIPQQYGTSPQSYIYRNDNGRFTDVTSSLSKDLVNVGLITSASWSDVNGDNRKELIVAGEWMPPRIFSFNGSQFSELTTSFSSFNGLWHSMVADDLDGDGDVDIVLGNAGENFYLRGSSSAPFKIWINDFDDNGTVDKVITRTVNGKDMPVFMKREMTEQIPGLKKQNLRNQDYANRTIQDLFQPAKVSAAVVKQVDFMRSIIAWNDGKGNFTVADLPYQVQLSCVNAILPVDIDRDGKKDLVMGGNEFGFLPQFSRLDASFGHVLMQRDGKFGWVEPARSGLQLSGEIRDIRLLTNRILILQNNEKPVWYTIR